MEPDEMAHALAGCSLLQIAIVALGLAAERFERAGLAVTAQRVLSHVGPADAERTSALGHLDGV